MDSLNEALIAAVQNRPPIYDKSDDNYFNRAFIARLWQEIGHVVGIDDQAARKKWTTLRDYFQKTHRQMTMAKSGNGEEKQRKWYLYDSLLFLLPYLCDRATTSNSNLSEHSVKSETAEVDECSQDRSYTPSPVHTTASTSIYYQQACEEQPLLTPRHSVAWKRKFPQERYALNTVDDRTLDTISPISETLTQKEVPDEDEMFCKSLVSKIKSLDPFSKMECQAEIHMVILRFMRQSTQMTTVDRQTQTYQSVTLNTTNTRPTTQEFIPINYKPET